jgi:hypothetical protein
VATQKDGSGRIRITSEHLRTDRINERVHEMEQAQKVALVRAVGSPNSQSGVNGAIQNILILGEKCRNHFLLYKEEYKRF